MRTRSGKTYFEDSDASCPICLEPSVSTRADGSRLLCVESCGCREPVTHAHCFLRLCKRRMMAGTEAENACPACTRDVADIDRVVQNAQYNHTVLRKEDPSYSSERSVVIHYTVEAIRTVVAEAKAYETETRNMALRFANHQNYLLSLVEAASRLVSSGDPERANNVLLKLRLDLLTGIAENRSRFSYEETLEYFMYLEEMRSVVFFYAGIDEATGENL